MTRRPDAGVIFAAVGGAAVLAAVIAGFVVIGGPGDARGRRLDIHMLQQMRGIATAAQCAYTARGEIPVSLAATRVTLDARTGQAQAGCEYVDMQPLETRLIDYSAPGGDTIELCADFQRPTPDEGEGQSYYTQAGGAFDFRELDAKHPAGRHCYNIKLVRVDIYGQPVR